MSMRHGYSRALIGWVAAHDMAWARHGISTGHSCSLVRFVFWPLNTLVPRGDRHRTFCRSHLHPHIDLDRTHPGTGFTIPPTLAPTHRRSIRYLPCCPCHTPRRDVSFSRNTTLPVLYDWLPSHFLHHYARSTTAPCGTALVRLTVHDFGCEARFSSPCAPPLCYRGRRLRCSPYLPSQQDCSVAMRVIHWAV